MKVTVDLCMVPLGVGVSLSRYIAKCVQIIKENNLTFTLHAYGTNVEGEWDEVFKVVKRCHEVVHQMGAPRITTTLKIGTRVDRHQSMAEKILSVEKKL